MKYLDFAMQSIIFAFGVLILIFTREDADWPLAIRYAQLILGPWQMISSLTSVVAKTPFYRMKRMHLLIALVYLIAMYAFTAAGSATIPYYHTVFGFLLTVPAWALAIFYYILTWKWVFTGKRRRGNFLPNLSF